MSISKLFLRNAMGCIIVCDIENKESLDNTVTWKQIVLENINTNI